MIAWVDNQCRAWSAHYRWVMTGEDGWPERSILGRLIEEGPGAGHTGYGSHVPIKDPPEAYTLVTLALRHMADTHEMVLARDAIHWHYLARGKASAKAPALGVSVKQYWNLIHTAHAYIAGIDARYNGENVPREALCTQSAA